jgi:hypothetical protein
MHPLVHAPPETRLCAGAAMLAVLEDNHARSKIEASVENELTNVHSGQYAGEIREEVPAQYREFIEDLAKSVRSTLHVTRSRARSVSDVHFFSACVE